MDIHAREQLLQDLADGRVSLRDLAGLKRRDVDAIAHLGRVAFESKKHDQAASIFRFLEELEPDRPEHQLHLAECLGAAGKKADALAALDRFIAREDYVPAEELVRAFLMRAQLCAESDRVEAAMSLRAVKLASERSPAAQRMLERIGL